MRGYICVLLLALIGDSLAKFSSPKVEVYSHKRGEYDKPNILICHVTDFYPPMISIDLLENGKPMAGVQQKDLAFEDTWHYHLTKYVDFTPRYGVDYSCRVTHTEKTTSHVWEADV